MDGEFPIILLNDSLSKGINYPENMTIYDCPVPVIDKSLEIRIAACEKPIGLADIVYTARELSDLISGFVREMLEEEGSQAACKEGCCYCCRQLILLSVPEALCLVTELTQLPQDMQEVVIQMCLKNAEVITQNLQKIPGIEKARDTFTFKNKVSDWFHSDEYYKLQLDCPFLYNSLCTIYDQRPAVCRDWLIKDSAQECKTGGVRKDNAVKLPFYTGYVLAVLASELENTELEYIALPTMFEWFKANYRRLDNTWPAKQIVEHFIDIIKRDTL